MEIRIGLESFIADVNDDDNGLIILICFGISGTVSPLIPDGIECEELVSESGFGDATNRIVGGDEEVDCCWVFNSADLAIERRIIRALLFNGGVTSPVV